MEEGIYSPPPFYITPIIWSMYLTCHNSETPPTTAPALIHSHNLHFCISSRSSLASLLHSKHTIRPFILPIMSGVPRSEKTLPCILIALLFGMELRYLSIGDTTDVYSSFLSRLFNGYLRNYAVSRIKITFIGISSTTA